MVVIGIEDLLVFDEAESGARERVIFIILAALFLLPLLGLSVTPILAIPLLVLMCGGISGFFIYKAGARRRVTINSNDQEVVVESGWCYWLEAQVHNLSGYSELDVRTDVISGISEVKSEANGFILDLNKESAPVIRKEFWLKSERSELYLFSREYYSDDDEVKAEIEDLERKLSIIM